MGVIGLWKGVGWGCQFIAVVIEEIARDLMRGRSRVGVHRCFRRLIFYRWTVGMHFRGATRIDDVEVLILKYILCFRIWCEKFETVSEFGFGEKLKIRRGRLTALMRILGEDGFVTGGAFWSGFRVSNSDYSLLSYLSDLNIRSS